MGVTIGGASQSGYVTFGGEIQGGGDGGGGGESGWSIGDVSTTLSPAFLYRLGGNMTDSSAGGNDLTADAGALSYPSWGGKQWGYFDGSTVLTAGSQAEHFYAGSHTVFAQILHYRNPTSTVEVVVRRGSANSAASEDNTLYSLAFSNGLYRYDYDTGAGAAASEFCSATTALQRTAAPYTFAYTYDSSGGTMTWYVNGMEVDTDAVAAAPTGGGDASLWIGGDDSGASANKVAFRNICGWSSALTEAQILATHNEAMG